MRASGVAHALPTVLQPSPFLGVRQGEPLDSHDERSLQVAELAKLFDWTGPIGCGFPAAVVGGVVMTAANIDNSWIGENAEQRFAKVLPQPTHSPTAPTATNCLNLQHLYCWRQQ
jgi:hypothetical protein